MIPDTIVAPATPPGYGGLSVVRISGNIACDIGLSISSRSFLKDRYSTYSILLDIDGQKMDDGLLTYFKGPNSYTGEDVVEVSCHGNPIIVDRIVSFALNRGARLAEPGEFTKRAFLNGRLDLVQAESVGKLIESQSIKASKMNNKVLSGHLSDRLFEMKNDIISSLSFLEFEFDISEDDDLNTGLIKKLHNSLNNNILACDSLISSYSEGRLYNKGAKVVICGEPNVGKSTLLNTILDMDRAITSSIPGTTRDFLESNILLSGVPVALTDTAGIRSSNDPLESVSVDRSRGEIKNADIILNVFCGSTLPIDYNRDRKHEILVYNKLDIKKPPVLRRKFISISALKNIGINKLKNELIKRLIKNNDSSSDIILTTRRQVNSIKECKECLERGLKILVGGGAELELIAFEFRDSINHIDILLGKTSIDDILDKVFSGFCVGK